MKNMSEAGYETPNDYGTETAVTPPSVEKDDDQSDIVDESIWGIMDEVIAFGYSEAIAEKKVRDAIEKLVKDEIISEVPEYDEPDGVKSAWISNSLPRVVNYLRMQGDIL
jgi:hypothetical protein